MAATGTLVNASTSTSDNPNYSTSDGGTLHANRPFVIAITNSKSSTPDVPNQPTTTHSGVTFASAQDESQLWGSSSLRRTTIWYGMASSESTGNFTVGFSANQTGCIIQVVEFDGADTTNANGSAAFINSTANVGVGSGYTSISTSLIPSHTNANGTSGTFAVVGHSAAETTTANGSPAGSNSQSYSSPTTAQMVAWYSGNNTTPGGSWATSVASPIVIGVEVQLAAATTAVKTVNTLARASVKSINGILIANVKTSNHLA